MRLLGSGESKLETIISYLLIAGVVLSLVFILVGLILFYLTYGHLDILLSDNKMVIQGSNFFSFIYLLAAGKYAANSSVLFITAGIVMLLLTPFVRVITSVIYFAWKKDIRYLLITAFVLIALTVSLALH